MSVGEVLAPSVLVVVLNWNGWEETLTSVDSVLRLDYANLRVLVVDNGSTDGSIEHLRTIRDDRVELLELPENRGYTGGCNEGFRRALVAGAHYVWLLNSDAVAEDTETLTSLVALAESDPKIGLVSPRLADPGEGGRLNWCGSICSTDPLVKDMTEDPEEARRWVLEYPNAGDVLGAAMLVKSSVIREIGMLDDGFFAYWEDTDYSYRSTLAGYRNLVAENCIIRHLWKHPTRNPFAIKPHVWYYLARNECRFWRKHMGVIRALRPCWWSFNGMLRNLLRCKGNPNLTDAMLAGLWHGWINRDGPYHSEFRMPTPLAAAIWRYAMSKAGPSPFIDGEN
jgi:GT2 family glycosyltransferase